MTDSPSQSRWHWGPIVQIAVGVILALGSIFADSLGFTWGGDGYGWKQMLATIAGLIIAVGGVGWWMRSAQSVRR